MSDEIVRMHLAQALTRTENPDARAHLRTAIDIFDSIHDSSAETGENTDLNPIDIAELELKAWLVRHARDGMAELVLSGILRDYSKRIEELGYVPRSWKSVRSEPDSTAAPPENSSACKNTVVRQRNGDE